MVNCKVLREVVARRVHCIEILLSSILFEVSSVVIFSECLKRKKIKGSEEGGFVKFN